MFFMHGFKLKETELRVDMSEHIEATMNDKLPAHQIIKDTVSECFISDVSNLCDTGRPSIAGGYVDNIACYVWVNETDTRLATTVHINMSRYSVPLDKHSNRKSSKLMLGKVSSLVARSPDLSP